MEIAMDVRIRRIEFNPPGLDRIGEHIDITSSASTPIDMTGWTLKDAAAHTFRFPRFVLAPGASMRIWTGEGKNDGSNLFWGRDAPIWNNTGDIAVLSNSSGIEQARCEYVPDKGQIRYVRGEGLRAQGLAVSPIWPHRSGGVHVFAIGLDNGVWQDDQDAARGYWGGWKATGFQAKDIVLARMPEDLGDELEFLLPPARLQAFAIHSSDSTVWTRWQLEREGAWSGWAPLGGSATSLAVGQVPGGGLEVFAVHPDGSVWHIWQDKLCGDWSQWESLGGAVERIAVGQIPDGGLEVFAVGRHGALWHIWQDLPKGDWSEWDNLGGSIRDLSVSADMNKLGGHEVFAVGSDGAVWHIWQHKPKGDWSPWVSHGGSAVSIASIPVHMGGVAFMFVGTDGAIWCSEQNRFHGDWSPLRSLGGNFLKAGACSLGGGGIEIFAIDTDHLVRHIWQDRALGQWTKWEPLDYETRPVGPSTPDKPTTPPTSPKPETSGVQGVSLTKQPGPAWYIYAGDSYDPLGATGALITSVMNNGTYSFSLAFTPEGSANGTAFYVIEPSQTVDVFNGLRVKGHWTAQFNGKEAVAPSGLPLRVGWRKP
jgi:hypothetical protein